LARRKNPVAENQPIPEISLKTLQNLSFELIAKAVTLWRTYSEDKDGKGNKINQSIRIHGMLTEAMKLHPDIQELAQIHQYYDEVKTEYELAVKSGVIKSGSPRTNKV
jgi:hypothetical protein